MITAVLEAGTSLLQDGRPEGWSTFAWVIVASAIVVGMFVSVAIVALFWVFVTFVRVCWFIFTSLLRIF